MKREIIGYTEIEKKDIPGYNDGYDYALLHIVGGCMDSPDSPQAVPDGSTVLGHLINRGNFMHDWKQYQGRLICIFPTTVLMPYPLIKEFVRLDWNWFLVLRMYVPPKEFDVPVDYIDDEILIVDKVMD